jgi:predicted transcriptional regulator
MTATIVPSFTHSALRNELGAVIERRIRRDVLGTLRLSVAIVSAYVRNNRIPISELSPTIEQVHGTLAALSGEEPFFVASPPALDRLIQKSITPNYLVCLEDGKKMKMLKRYLRRRYGLSPDEYRAKWHLSDDYPMVAPSYAVTRSSIAKKFGLGRTKRSARRT